MFNLNADLSILRRFLVFVSITGLAAGAAFIEFGEGLGLNPSVSRDHWRLLGFYLAANALFLWLKPHVDRLADSEDESDFWLTGFSSWIGFFPLLMMAAVNAGLTLSVAFNMASEAVWATILLVPAIASAWTAWHTEPEEGPALDHEVSGSDESPEDGTGIGEDAKNGEEELSSEAIRDTLTSIQGGAEYQSRLTPYLVGAAIGIISFGGFALYALVGTALFLTLEDLVVFDIATTTADFLTQLVSLMGEYGLQAAIYGGISAIITIISTMLTIFFEKRLAARHDFFSRQLYESDLDWLEGAFRQLIGYTDNVTYPRLYQLIHMPVGLVLLVGGMLIIGGIAALAVVGIHEAMLPLRADGAEVIDYGGHGWAAIFIGGFAGIMLPWPALQIAGHFNRRFGEYLYVKGGWNTSKSEPRTYYDYIHGLMRHYRRGDLSSDQQFDPQTYLRSAFHEFNGMMIKVSFGIAIVILLAIPLDIRSYHLITDEYIEKVSWHRLGKATHPYAEIETVRITCREGKSDDKKAIRLTYEVLLPDGSRLDILDNNPGRADLARLEEIDRRLERAGARFEPNDLERTSDELRNGFADCREVAIDYLGGERGNRLADILDAP